MASGVVALLFSFFKFYGVGDFGSSAWASGLFPVATLMAIVAAVMAVQIALSKFAGVDLPDPPAGLTWVQVHLVLGFFAALYAIAWLIRSTGGADRKIGFWGVLIGCIGAFVGAIILYRERQGGSVGGGGGGAAPPRPGGGPTV
jgi:hypothetical protein